MTYQTPEIELERVEIISTPLGWRPQGFYDWAETDQVIKALSTIDKIDNSADDDHTVELTARWVDGFEIDFTIDLRRDSHGDWDIDSPYTAYREACERFNRRELEKYDFEGHEYVHPNPLG